MRGKTAPTGTSPLSKCAAGCPSIARSSVSSGRAATSPPILYCPAPVMETAPGPLLNDAMYRSTA